MATFVLVHGACHGGWCWRKVRPLLRAAGHDVFTPTLTGLGERVHLAHPAVDLDTHIQDITATLEYEDLHEVVLVGHSYAGMVITGVADAIPERLAQLVYLDAGIPHDGEAALDLFSAGERAARHAQVATTGEGWRIMPPSEEKPWGVQADADLHWLRPRLTAQPFRTFTQPIRLTKPVITTLPKVFIHCTETPPATWRHISLQRVQREPGWHYYELATGHDAMVTLPHELAEILLSLVDHAPALAEIEHVCRG